MTFHDLVTELKHCFEPVKLEDHEGEFGYTDNARREIGRVGYATNLDPVTAREAIEANVDALITHHDAWDFLHELRAEAYALLEAASVSHCYVHLPLDAAPFGTSATLVRRLGLEITGSFAADGSFACGRIGTYASPRALEDVISRLEEVTGATVRSWLYGASEVRTLGITTGGGALTDLVREAIALGCDTYITGESNVYMVQYARHRSVNLIVGTHSHTEFPGVESLCELLRARTDLTFVPIHEEDFESGARARRERGGLQAAGNAARRHPQRLPGRGARRRS